MKIGIFDSGFGGTAIFRKIKQRLPEYDYIYFGDTANLPYGEKSPKEIYQLTKQAVEFLFQKNCAIIILACNTASAHALRRLQQEYIPSHYPDRRILGIVRPTTESAADHQSIGILATNATIHSKIFSKEIQALGGKTIVEEQACPDLVPLIEASAPKEIIMKTIHRYIDPLLCRGVKTLILACTHYELIQDHIAETVGPSIHILSQGNITAEKFVSYLKRHPEVEITLTQEKSITFYFSQIDSHTKKKILTFMQLPESAYQLFPASSSRSTK